MSDNTVLARTCASTGCERKRSAGSFYCAHHRGGKQDKPLNQRSAARRASSKIGWLFAGGLVLSVCGAFFLSIAGDGAGTIDEFGRYQPQQTDPAIQNWGLFLFGVGSILAFVAIVAWAVMLGARAARD